MEISGADIFQLDPDEIDESIVFKIEEYSDEIFLQDKEFFENVMEKVPYSQIPWETPWYQVLRAATKDSIKSTDERFKEQPFRVNTFQPEETLMMHRNWKEFVKTYDIPDQPTTVARFKDRTSKELLKVRSFIIAYVARGLERTLHQVYLHFIIEFLYVDKGPYTKTEEKIITTYLRYCGYTKSPVFILARALGRSPRRIYIKLDEIRNGKKPHIVKQKWDLERAGKLLKLLMKYTKLPLEALKNIEFERAVWLAIEKKMKNKILNLQRFWYSKLHVQLFVKKHLKLRKVLQKLFLLLKSSPYKKWSHIRWDELVKEFPDGCTKYFLYYNAISLLRPSYPQRYLSVSKVADYFLENSLDKIRRRRLKLIKYNEDGTLEYIKHEKK